MRRNLVLSSLFCLTLLLTAVTAHAASSQAEALLPVPQIDAVEASPVESTTPDTELGVQKRDQSGALQTQTDTTHSAKLPWEEFADRPTESQCSSDSQCRSYCQGIAGPTADGVCHNGQCYCWY